MTLNYLDELAALKDRLDAMGSPAKLDLPFEPGRPPTQAFSQFLNNKEQGDWAEQTFIDNFNRTQPAMWATKYGSSVDLVAGDVGFDDYYREYQTELVEIGKRPDVLIFDRGRIQAKYGAIADVSALPRAELETLVPDAVAAIEIRSSSFLSAKYDAAAAQARDRHQRDVEACARSLVADFAVELRGVPDWERFASALLLNGVENAGDPPRAIAKKSTDRLRAASQLTKRIKDGLGALGRRDFLSITPKSEDLSLVYRWIQRFGVQHHYCQVFFDRAVVIPFKRILEIIADPTRENVDYFIEADEKNQYKSTFKINVKLGTEVLSSVALPRHCSVMKELPKGRLIFFVRFEPSHAAVNLGGIVSG
jgi:hypothetical protein